MILYKKKTLRFLPNLPQPEDQNNDDHDDGYSWSEADGSWSSYSPPFSFIAAGSPYPPPTHMARGQVNDKLPVRLPWERFSFCLFVIVVFFVAQNKKGTNPIWSLTPKQAALCKSSLKCMEWNYVSDMLRFGWHAQEQCRPPIRVVT